MEHALQLFEAEAWAIVGYEDFGLSNADEIFEETWARLKMHRLLVEKRKELRVVENDLKRIRVEIEEYAQGLERGNMDEIKRAKCELAIEAGKDKLVYLNELREHVKMELQLITRYLELKHGT